MRSICLARRARSAACIAPRAGPRKPSPSMPCRRSKPRSCRSTARVTYSRGIRSEGRTAMSNKRCVLLVLAAQLWAGASAAQAPAPSAPPPTTPYGAPIGIEDAKKAAAAAVAEVAKAGSPPDAIAIVDHGGFLIYFERMDNTQLGSVEVAIEKARSAALFRRPSKVFEDALAGGGVGMRILALHGAMPVEGGVPIISGGKLVGAIGASGGTAQQDGQVAKAGADAIK